VQAAAIGGEVLADGAVGQRRRPAAGQTAARTAGIAADRAVGELQCTVVIENATTVGGRVAADGGVGNRQRTITVDAAAVGGRLPADRAVVKRRLAMVVAHPPAGEGGGIAADHAVR